MNSPARPDYSDARACIFHKSLKICEQCGLETLRDMDFRCQPDLRVASSVSEILTPTGERNAMRRGFFFWRATLRRSRSFPSRIAAMTEHRPPDARFSGSCWFPQHRSSEPVRPSASNAWYGTAARQGGSPDWNSRVITRSFRLPEKSAYSILKTLGEDAGTEREESVYKDRYTWLPELRLTIPRFPYTPFYRVRRYFADRLGS
jgi:hypothetical protein